MTTERLRRLLNEEGGVARSSIVDMMDATEHEKREYLKMAREAANRDKESLRLYEPLPFQKAYHECRARELLLAKGNRVGGEQPLGSRVMTPTGVTTIGELAPGDEVLGGDGLPCVVDEVIEYGASPVYRLTFSDGAAVEAGEDHKWTCRIGGRRHRPQGHHVDLSGWRVHTTNEINCSVKKHGYRFGEGRQDSHHRVCFPTAVAEFGSRPVPLDPYTLGVLIGDGNFTHRHVSVTSEDEEVIADMLLPEDCDIVKLDNLSANAVERYGKACCYSIRGTKWRQNPVLDALDELGLRGLMGHEKFIPHLYIYNSLEVRLGVLQGLLDTDGRCGKVGYAEYYTTSSQMVDGVSEIVRSLGGRVTVNWRENSHRGHPGRPLAHVVVVLSDFNPFRLSRKRNRRNALRGKYRNFRYLEKIEHVGVKKCRCINVRNASRTYLTENYIVTHNSLAGFLEDARACTNQDPYNKYPKKDGVCVCLGYGENHIGRVIHKFLFRPGAFKIIRDLESGLWRVFKPWSDAQGGDQSRVAEAEDAPPLIPPRLIENFHWDSRGARVFTRCELKTGWEIYALNSAGDPSQAQGFNVDLYHIDEDTAQAGWYEEAVARVAITSGRIRWTALPHSKNDDILNMMERAEDQKDLEHPITVCLRASLWDNPYIPEESKQASIRAWADQGEDVVRKRAYGDLVIDSVLMYPSFSKYAHDIVCPDRSRETPAQRLWRAANYGPPANWCRSFVLDPGHTIAAGLFFATPPPGLGNFRVCYDEAYIHQCTSAKLTAEVQKRTQGYQFERFIIDAHGGRLTDFGSGIRPQQQYETEFLRNDVRCNSTDNYFIHGSDDIQGREESLRQWLRIQANGCPAIYIDAQRCPNLVREMMRFKKKQQRIGSNMITLDEANRKGQCHAVEALEMAAANGLEYVAPKSSKRTNSWVQTILKGRAERTAQREAKTGAASSGSISLAPRGASL